MIRTLIGGRCLAGMIVLMFALVFRSGSLEAIVLAGNGQTAYRIIVSESASASEKAGAGELAKYLKQISGAEFPVATDKEPRVAREIIVGNNEHLRSLGIRIDWRKLGDQGLCIKTAGETLVIAGGPRGGVINGVYEFLERFLGCRWYAPDLTVVPRQPAPTITALDYYYVPQLKYRRQGWYGDRLPDWAAPNHINAFIDNAIEVARRDPRLSDSWFCPENAAVHTLTSKLCSVNKYFDAHPEYFAEIDGQRIREHTQLCLANPKVLETVVNDARALLARYPQDRRISVSAEDWENYCRCPECRKLYAKYGVAGTYIEFANRCAAGITRYRPDVIVDTLAYRWQRGMPPDITYHPNFGVVYAPAEGCIYHALDDCAYNADQKYPVQLKAWAGAANHLTMWFYTDSAEYLIPHPIIHALGRNFKLARELGADGVFVEGETRYFDSQLGALTSYLIAKLLWNPNYDVDRGIDEFIGAYYGPAAPEIRRYVSAVNSGDSYTGTNGAGMRSYPGFHAAMQNPESLDLKPDVLAELSGLFDAAERKVAADPRLLRRVKVVRMPLQVKIIAQLPAGNASREQAMKDLRAFLPQTDVNTILMVSPADYWQGVAAGDAKARAVSAALPSGRDLATVPEFWFFRTDPEKKGEAEKWFLAGKVDGSWKPISTRQFWDYALEKSPYPGDGWYALDITIPPGNNKKVWLIFGAVDENYTLWLNGKYVGDNLDAGTKLWDQPVAVEITGKYLPGNKNHLVVRVRNTIAAGGIWKPVRIIVEE